ncbi:hypothetical protein BVRB_002820 [Beta vulgaris subsp. vulgaris]|uniref:Uncharacterized protein n=1 Tax=Beta vulgaris subsp. vulgaris TaxID=3555 RepID=A0A0J8B7V9_BETVV|nr:hypothetical protein BVRB_002820 [Beta vulgaris subsp. vulgaris]
MAPEILLLDGAKNSITVPDSLVYTAMFPIWRMVEKLDKTLISFSLSSLLSRVLHDLKVKWVVKVIDIE